MFKNLLPSLLLAVLTIAVVLSNSNSNNNVPLFSFVEAVTAPSRCDNLLEASTQSVWCDSSACLNSGTKNLCAERGTCISGGSCSDCSWTAQGVTAASDCSTSTSYPGPPGIITDQNIQLARQLNLPVLILNSQNYLPETMESFQQGASVLIERRGASGQENFIAPTVCLFIDEPNSTYSGIKFGVGAPVFGYVPDLSNEAQIDKDLTPLFNYYYAALPVSQQAVDWNVYYQYADMNVGDMSTSIQFSWAKSDSETYLINADVASRLGLHNNERIPNLEHGQPYTFKFRPFIKQAGYYRPIRSTNMTKRIADYAATLSQEQTGAGQLFKLEAGFNSFLANASTFSTPASLPSLRNAIGMMDYTYTGPVLSKFLLPGVMRMKLTTQSENWYIPIISWRVQTWVAGESPLLIYQGMQASPEGTGSHASSVYHKTNTLSPIAAVDTIDTNNTGQTELEDSFDYDSKPVNVDTCGNVATILYLENGSMRVIFKRDAKTHQYIASASVRAKFTDMFLGNGTYNVTAQEYKCASWGDDFVLYKPGGWSIWPFGPNTANRFGHRDPFKMNVTLEGEELNFFSEISAKADHINETITQVAISGDFMVVITFNGFAYYAGNSLYEGRRFACCSLAVVQKLTWITDLNRVREVHLGESFSIYFRREAPYVQGCGQQSTITPFFGTLTPVVTTFTFPDMRSQVVKKVCTGLYHACILAANGRITCWGYMRSSPNYRICSGTHPGYGQGIAAFQSGEDMFCGHSHVVIKRWSGENQFDQTELQSYSVCGSADRGQLGAAYQLSSENPDPNARPLFAVPQRLANAETADTSGDANLFPPVMEVYKMVAHNDATYAFTEPRRHASIEMMLTNWVSNIGRPPPTGWHKMSKNFGLTGPFWIDFTTIPGIPLTAISNQSQGSTWLTPTESSTQLPADGSGDLNITGNKWVYFRNWTKLMKNVTTKLEEFGATPFLVGADLALDIPHLVITMSTGEVMRLGMEAVPCAADPLATANYSEWERVKIWCDAATPTRIVWRASGTAIPGGYTDALASTPWIALSIRIRHTRFLRTLRVKNNIFLNMTTFMHSQPSVIHFYAQYHIVRWGSPPCSTIASPTDCGGAVFFESYMQRQQPQSVTRTTLMSFPVNGVNVKTYNITPTMLQAVQIEPLLIESFVQVSGSVPGLRGNSQKYVGFLNVCIFLKLGYRYYWIMLKPNGAFDICSMGPAATTNPASVPTQYSANGRKWDIPYPGLLHLQYIDNFYINNYDPEYEINDVYFNLSCSGGLLTKATLTNGTWTIHWTNHSAFVLLTNDSIDELFNLNPLWWYQDTYTTTAANSYLLQERLYGPYGCDGGLTVPIQPMVEATSFHTFIQTENYMHSTDEIVIAINSPVFSSLHTRYFFVIGKDGPTIERITDTTNWVKSRQKGGRTVTKCDPIPIRTFRNHWNSFSMIHNISTGKTEVWLNGKLSCQPGTYFTEFSPNQPFVVSGIYVGIRNSERPFTAIARFRELVLCDSRKAGYKMFGCSAGLISYDETVMTNSISISESHTYHLSESVSLQTKDTLSESFTRSGTETFSHAITESYSPDNSLSFSRSTSSSYSIELSLSNSTSFSHSESFSHIHIHNLHLIEFNGDLVSSNLIRRTGLHLEFYLEGDLWNPYADWKNSPAGYLLFASNLDKYENPNALGYSYIISDVLSAVVRKTNWSILEMQLGPSGNYNSGREETVVFRPKKSGVASHILPPNNITITIPGAGFFVKTTDKVVELLAAVGVLLNVFALGPGSIVIRFSSNMILTNFQCYNNEAYPQTFLFNPLRLTIGGSLNLGLALGNFMIIVSIFVVFIIAMLVFKSLHNRGWNKTYGQFGYPSLPILLSIFFVPGFMFGAWRTAFEAESAIYYLVPLGSVVVIFIPLIYLYGKIMDDANFEARFEHRDERVLEIRAKKYPIWSQFQIPGAWVATDKYGEFVHQLEYFFRECAENRRYWVLYELVCFLMESFICSITNTKYSFCGIQMLVVFLMRCALLVSSIRLRPRSAAGNHWVSVTLYAGQAIMALIVAAYAFQRLTNTLRKFVGFMLIGSAFTVGILATLTAIGAAHERYLEAIFYRILQRESAMIERAPPHKERVVEDIIMAEEPGGDGEGGNDGDEDEMQEIVSGSGEVVKRRPKNLDPTAAASAVEIGDNSDLDSLSPIRGPASSKMSPLAGGDGEKTFTSEEASLLSANPLTQEELEEAERKAAAEAEEKKKKKMEARNVWKLIAMEEANDRPTKEFDVDDEL